MTIKFRQVDNYFNIVLQHDGLVASILTGDKDDEDVTSITISDCNDGSVSTTESYQGWYNDLVELLPGDDCYVD